MGMTFRSQAHKQKTALLLKTLHPTDPDSKLHHHITELFGQDLNDDEPHL